MSQKNRIFLLFLFLGYCFGALQAETEYGFFDHYTSKDGLISNRIFSIDHDKNGFIWIGTDFGLERFDGKTFKHHRKNDYNGILREDFLFVRCLPNGCIAAGGYAGLHVEYNPVQDSFRNVMPEEFKESFYKETMDVYLHNDEQYTYSSAGAYIYDTETESYSSDNSLFKATQKLFVRSMYIDKKQRFWIGSMDSMLVFNSDGQKIYRYKPKEACSFVRTILPLNDSLILVASQSSELWIFNTQHDTIQSPQIIHAPFDCITNIVGDDMGRYWIATDAHGLWYTDDFLSASPRFVNLIPFDALPDEIRKIYCIMKDPNGDIWFGTQNTGIWRYKKRNTTGVNYSWNFGFPSTVCSSFSEDDQQNIIIGVDGGGLYSVDAKYNIQSAIKFPNNNISGIARTSSGIYYVATWGGGIYRWNQQNGSYVRDALEGIDSPSNCFFGVSVTNGDEIFACSSGDGYYHKKEGDRLWKKVIPYDSITGNDNTWVMSVYDGGKNSHWILTTNSLWREENGQLVSYAQESSSLNKTNSFDITDIAPDTDGYLYATTNKGIMRFSPDKKEPEILEFVPKSYYRSIVKDDNGNVWIVGDNGIHMFNYNKKTCQKLPGNYSDVATFFFYLRSGYKASNGNLYFGTNGGYISINPNRLDFDTVIPYLSFSNLTIKGEKISTQSELLKNHPLSEISELELAYNKTNISVDVDIIDFSDLDRIQCQYRLVGLQNEWTELPNDKNIKFTYIPTGDYTLEVKAFRTNEKCEQKIISLPITVLPPWWNTWWFRLILCALLLVAIYEIFQWRMRRLIRIKNELNEQVALRTLELQNALKDKDSLISVIGHDLKNPMFAIVVALENWLTKEKAMTDEGKRKLIVEVHDSAKSLQGEMLKLLDWALSKKDDLVCKPQDFDMEKVIDDAVQLTAEMMKRKNISFQKNCNLTHKAYADSRMISAVVRNLLGNAVKFTEMGGTIQIDVQERDGEMTMIVKDSGVGMSADTLTHLLSDENIKSSLGTDNEEGTGLGMKICKKYVLLNNGTFTAESQLGEGTSFIITLPCSEFLTVMEKATEIEENNDEKEENNDILSGNVILIVDDNPLICENMKMLLSDFCETLIAYDGKQALDIINENDVDLILSDVDMPILNGIEMCQQLQKDDCFSHIPILFLSGRTDESDRILGLKNGAIDYISKPFSHEELLAKLRSILKLRKQERTYLLARLMEGKTEASEEEGEEEISKENPFVTKYMDLVREHHSNANLSVDELAEKLCVSRSTMFRRIKAVVGKSPVELLNEYRLNEAMRLLKAGDESSVNEIAYSVGFSDPSYFSKRFKAYFGVSPTQAKG